MCLLCAENLKAVGLLSSRFRGMERLGEYLAITKFSQTLLAFFNDQI